MKDYEADLTVIRTHDGIPIRVDVTIWEVTEERCDKGDLHVVRRPTRAGLTWYPSEEKS